MTEDEMEDIIQKITLIRADNNLNWLGLLRLALKAEPEKAKKLLRQITDNDSEVSYLTHELSKE